MSTVSVVAVGLLLIRCSSRTTRGACDTPAERGCDPCAYCRWGAAGKVAALPTGLFFPRATPAGNVGVLRPSPARLSLTLRVVTRFGCRYRLACCRLEQWPSLAGHPFTVLENMMLDVVGIKRGVKRQNAWFLMPLIPGVDLMSVNAVMLN